MNPEDRLAALLSTGGPWAPEILLQIAELTELVQGDDAARIWWERAAAAGDTDAVDYLMILIEEGENW